MSTTAISLQESLQSKRLATHAEAGLYDKAFDLIVAHNEDAYTKLSRQLKPVHDLQYTESSPITIGERLLIAAIQSLNYPVYRQLMYWDKTHQHTLTTGKCAFEVFVDAIRNGVEMASEVYAANPLVLQARGSSNATLFSHIIAEVTGNMLMRCGKFQTAELEQKIKAWYWGKQETVQIPSEGIVVRYEGPIDMVNFLFGLKANFWDVDGHPNLPCTAIEMVNDIAKYKDRFKIGICRGKELELVSNEGAAPFLRGTMTVRCRVNKEKRIKVTVEYHFEQLQALFNKAQERKTYDERITYEQFQHQAIKTDHNMGLLAHKTEYIQHNVSSLEQKTNQIDHNTHVLARQAYMQEANLNALATASQLSIADSHEKRVWEMRESAIRTHKLLATFYNTINSSLKANIMASLVLSTDKVEHRANTEEKIITGLLDLIGTHVPLFGSVLNIASTAVTAGFEWRADQFNAKVTKLLAPIKSLDDFTYKTAIEITEPFKFLFDNNIINTEKQAVDAAKKVSYFLMFTLSNDTIKVEKYPQFSQEQNIRMQLCYYFSQSAVFEKFKTKFVFYMLETAPLSTENQPTIAQNVLSFSNGHTHHRPSAQATILPQKVAFIPKGKKNGCLVM